MRRPAPTLPTVTVHVFTGAGPACRFTGLIPIHWPPWNIAIPRSELEATRQAISDPESSLCELQPYTICEACEQALEDKNAITTDVPVIVAVNRRCMACGLRLTPWWPASFCSQVCYLAAEGSTR